MKVPENNKGLNHAATFCVLGFKLHIFNVNFFYFICRTIEWTETVWSASMVTHNGVVI